MKGLILWETNVGSHMWGMERPDSDVDIFRAYAAPAREILIGTADMKSSHVIGDIEDCAIHEIGHIISHRLKGNVNFLWGIHSPIVLSGSQMGLGDLKKISEENLAKNTYHSIKGLAVKNKKKYVDNTPKSWEDFTEEVISFKKHKKIRIIARTAMMGVLLLKGRGVRFPPVNIEVSSDDLVYMINELDSAYEDSSLPEKPDEEPFRLWLEKIRMRDVTLGMVFEPCGKCELPLTHGPEGPWCSYCDPGFPSRWKAQEGRPY